jgi:hypothetical protein
MSKSNELGTVGANRHDRPVMRQPSQTRNLLVMLGKQLQYLSRCHIPDGNVSVGGAAEECFSLWREH